MRDPELLCLGCMEMLNHPGETCKKCGFDRVQYEKQRNVHTLPSYTILAGKYLLGRVLGEGGFGITYIAWDLNRECRVAVKEYFPSGLATRDTRLGDGEALTILPGEKTSYYQMGLKNFAEEGKNLARFQDLPGIVSVRDFFQDNRTAYIVMDYVEGMNLKQYLRHSYEMEEKNIPMTEEQVLGMMRPVLDSLIHIHKAGIVHRDISPENIICGSDGKITLIDFGAARVATGTETKSLTIMLKHGYAPPEQYQSHGKQGPWTDIYAICATMYHMLTGQLPMESIDRVFEDELPAVCEINPSVSKEVSDVIKKGMAVRWEERYQKVEEMREILYPEPDVEETAMEEMQEEDTVVEIASSEKRIEDYPKSEIKKAESVCETSKRSGFTPMQIVSAIILSLIVIDSFIFKDYSLFFRHDQPLVRTTLPFVLMFGRAVILGGIPASLIASFIGGRICIICKRQERVGDFIDRMFLLFVAFGVFCILWAESFGTEYFGFIGLILFWGIHGILAWPWAYQTVRRGNTSRVRICCTAEAGILVMLAVEMIIGGMRYGI